MKTGPNLSTQPPGCDLFATGPSDFRKGVRFRSEQNLHPVTGGGGPAGGVAEGQAGGAGGAHPEDLEGVAREAELGQAAGQPDRDLDLLEAVEGQVAHHGAEDAEEAGVGRCHCAEALQALAGATICSPCSYCATICSHCATICSCLLGPILTFKLPCPRFPDGFSLLRITSRPNLRLAETGREPRPPSRRRVFSSENFTTSGGYVLPPITRVLLTKTFQPSVTGFECGLTRRVATGCGRR